MKTAPAIHVTLSATAVPPSVMSHIAPPKALSGLAHVKCCPQTLSITASEGTTKLNAVTTQIQYFAVALAARIDVSAQTAEPAMDAYSRWTLK
jgi:hypothetical protein